MAGRKRRPVLIVDRWVLLAALALATSSLVIANTIVKPQPIEIVIKDGVSAVFHTPTLYTAREVLIMVISAWVGGISAAFIYVRGGATTPVGAPGEIRPAVSAEGGIPAPGEEGLSPLEATLRALKGPERTIFKVLVDKGGEVLQKDLQRETGYSKATVSRALKKLQSRGLIKRRRHGWTKKVVLPGWMRETE